MSSLRLPDDEYHALCFLVLMRDSYKCQSCGFRGNLNAHHVIFRSHGGEDTMENLCTVCASCHRGIHEERGLLVEYTDTPGVFKFTRINGWRPHG